MVQEDPNPLLKSLLVFVLEHPKGRAKADVVFPSADAVKKRLEALSDASRD